MLKLGQKDEVKAREENFSCCFNLTHQNMALNNHFFLQNQSSPLVKSFNEGAKIYILLDGKKFNFNYLLKMFWHQAGSV
jgi:hypothetical protein